MYSQDFIDQILTSLRVIAMIKEGQKVKVRNGLLDLEPVSTGLRAAIRRWVHNDNRNTTVLYIKNVVSNASDLIHLQVSQTEKIKEAMNECVAGLGALSVTYGEDASITATLHVLQERIKNEINNTRQYNNNEHRKGSHNSMQK